MSYSPLFQVMFALQNFPMGSTGIPDLTLIPAAVDSGTSMFDLALYMGEEGKGLSGKIEYNTELFDAATIERMAGHFGTLLESVVADPAQRVSELELLTEAERHKLLVEWNATEAAYPADKTLVQLFEEQVVRSPEAVAVTCKDTKLTYGELNRKANRLASYLRSLGVGPDVLVGLCMERSVDMVVGLLGVLKAGGAYVPLDPGFPIDRLQFMLEDSGVPILLTQAALAGDMSGYNGKTVCIDSDWGRISKQSDLDPKSLAGADHLAYVIYTSGSTGRPKGVQIPHRAFVNFLCSMQREPGLSPEDTVLSVTTISFDIFGLELFLPLISGAKVVLVERDDAADGARLIELLKESEATAMQATPATWRLLLQAGWEGNRLLKILCGGEALPRDLVAPLLGRCKEFWNLYGPTETTIWSTVCQVKSKEDPILIGRPIANTQLYILDNSLQPTPAGVVGELHIGGEGLARGYLNRPELTAEKFIPHPFSTDPNARVYKTGDLARYRSDGTIECLGRIDHQVKVRGYRIELGEIESRIKEAEAVGNCVVVLREDRPGDQRLTAYYVPRDGQAVSVFEVRRHLQSKLPEYMVPQHYVELSSIPLTPNGKVDRKALPKPERDGATEQGYVAPRTETERKIAAVWQEVLDRERVGLQDDFFDLGGHSLLATQVMSRINRLFDVQMPLRRLFEARTVGGLAEHIASEGQQEEQSPISRISRDSVLSVAFSQERLWFLFQLEPGNTAYHISGGVRLEGQLRVGILKQSLSEIVRRHEALRTTFKEIEGRPVQVISPEAAFELPVVDLQELPEAEREARSRQIIAEESQRPLDLSAGPLFRAALVQLSQEEHILVVVMHHIITDGWSLGVFTRELEALYAAFSEGKPSPLPDLPVQYADYAAWQRERLQGEVLEGQVAYWKEQLAGELTQLQLPTDRPRPAVQTHRGARHGFDLPKGLAEKINNLSRQQGVTLFMTLLAAFKVLLYRYTGQTDFAVGSPIANRTRSELEGLIGFFVNTLVLRTDMAGDPSFIELLGRVREDDAGCLRSPGVAV